MPREEVVWQSVRNIAQKVILILKYFNIIFANVDNGTMNRWLNFGNVSDSRGHWALIFQISKPKIIKWLSMLCKLVLLLPILLYECTSQYVGGLLVFFLVYVSKQDNIISYKWLICFKITRSTFFHTGTQFSSYLTYFILFFSWCNGSLSMMPKRLFWLDGVGWSI